ncbi:MAG TPA: HlyU family transcriptional regulator [Methylomirabilota bacterium]|jgi:hypothetical protein|nr:HlyU family transcriptional regulator [Methylomirabilota bacterium]
MVSFLRRLFSPGSRVPETPRPEASVEYKGYTITAAPERESGGWRLAGTISTGAGGDRKVHQLVRADTSPDRDAIVTMTIAKAKRIIDEQGDRLFGDG